MIALKTEIYVKAYLKRLEIHGIPAYVSRHGDDDAGDLIVKICTLDGRASLFRREYNQGTGERHWTCVLSSIEAEVDRSITKQCGFDPDLWVLEIEDAKGRHFLDVKSSPKIDEF